MCTDKKIHCHTHCKSEVCKLTRSHGKGGSFPSLRAKFSFSYKTGGYVGPLKRMKTLKSPEISQSGNFFFFFFFNLMVET